MLKQVALLKHFCDTVWEYDVCKNQIYIYYDTMFPELCGKWVDYNKMYQQHLTDYVYREDIAIWQQYMSPENLRDFQQSNEEEVQFCVRIENTESGMQWHEAYIENNGDRLIIGSRDIKAQQRNATIAQAVLPEFDYVCRINVHSQSYILYYSANEKTIVPQHESDNYHKIMEDFNRKYVVEDEVEILIQNMHIENVVKELEKQEEYILYVTMKDTGNKISYKKLRFCYADDSKEVILLTRTDVSDVMYEKKKRQKVEQRRKDLLTKMPIALCSIEVLLDEEKKPYDFRFTYCNPTHEKIEGVQPGELLNKDFYRFFKNTDPKWLQYYYETACLGIPHIIREYSPEIEKDLLIHTFRTEMGHCNCILQDVTKENFLLRELHQSREEMKRILETTTDAVFQYDPVTDEIQRDDYTTDGCSQMFQVEDLLGIFNQKGRVNSVDVPLLKDCFSRIKKGEHNVTAAIRCKKGNSAEWRWFKVSLFDYQDENTKERKVLGYIQDINRDMARQNKLREQAQTDALTGIFNVGAGREKIQKILSGKQEGYKAMFMMDVDDFKRVNDTHGHIVGDSTLQCFAEVLKKTFDKDTMKDVVIYRLGGDEFSVFLPQLQDAEKEVAAIMEDFHKNVKDAQKDFPFFSVSVGVYITNRVRNYEELYIAADKALYQTKKTEKDYYTVLKD